MFTNYIEMWKLYMIRNTNTDNVEHVFFNGVCIYNENIASGWGHGGPTHEPWSFQEHETLYYGKENCCPFSFLGTA